MHALTLTLVLGGLAMLGPFATDTYLPSFPSIAAHYGVGDVAVQQTLSIYLFGYAVMNLFYGPLSDAFGRRPVILASLLLFTLASIGAALAPSLNWLLVFRLLQGISAGAGMVVGQAIVRDLLHGAAAQRMMSHIMMVFGVAPAIAPVIGGHLNVYLGWQANFALLCVIGLLLIVLTLLWLPESLPPKERHTLHPVRLLHSYQHALTFRPYMLGVLSAGFAFSGFALYISSAAHFVMDVLQLPETAFAWLFVPMIGGMVAGSGLGARLAHRLRPHTQLTLGMGLMSLAALANVAYCALFAATIPWAVLPIFAYTFGVALVMPVLSVAAQSLLPTMRGLAASVQNFVQMLIFALISGFVAPALFDSALHLAAGLVVGVALSVGFAWAFVASQASSPQPSPVPD